MPTTRPDLDQVRLGPADQRAQRLETISQLARVPDRIERPVEGREDAVVDDLQDDHQGEDQPDDHGQDASTGGGQEEGQCDQDKPLERDPEESAHREVFRLVGSDEDGPHHQRREDRQGHCNALSHAPSPGVGPGGRVDRGPDGRALTRPQLWLRGVPVAPQPPNVVAKGLREQDQGHDERGRGHGGRQDVRGRDGQHNPLYRGDDLAPVARGQRFGDPRQRPPGGEEHVARGADHEHPGAGRAGDIRAEDQDQKRIDLGIEASALLRRARSPRDPSVDRVQCQRDRRQRHQEGDRHGRAQRVRDQRRDRDGECGSREGHPIRGGQPLAAVVQEPLCAHRYGDCSGCSVVWPHAHP